MYQLKAIVKTLMCILSFGICSSNYAQIRVLLHNDTLNGNIKRLVEKKGGYSIPETVISTYNWDSLGRLSPVYFTNYESDTLAILTTTYNDKIEVSSIVLSDINNEPCEKDAYKFDSKGRLTEHRHVDFYGDRCNKLTRFTMGYTTEAPSISVDSGVYTTYYLYNNAGNKVEALEYIHHSGLGWLDTTYNRITYNEQGNETTYFSIGYEQGSSWRYEAKSSYNSNNLLSDFFSQRLYFSSPNTKPEITINKKNNNYDSAGNLILRRWVTNETKKYKTWEYDGEKITSLTIFKYHNKQLIEEKEYYFLNDSSAPQSSKTKIGQGKSYERDSIGKVISYTDYELYRLSSGEEIKANFDKTDKTKENSKYHEIQEKDKYGNLILDKTEKDGSFSRFLSRKIEYYD